uniref:Uncharacterized protein n=1 Tax=Rhizophora mucronata TaxID=61149 RepID=A0A2P2P107_RHIMU
MDRFYMLMPLFARLQNKCLVLTIEGQTSQIRHYS